MADDYPNDADGDALRRVALDGNNMSEPMLVDISVDVPRKASGDLVARAAARIGYATSVEEDSEDGSWTCYCSKRMVLTYDSIILAQDELDAIAKRYGGKSDGWGTFGNVESV